MPKLNSPWPVGRLKDAGILLGWIAAMFLLAGLAWFLFRPARAEITLRNVNLSLRSSGEARQLEAPLVLDIPRWRANRAAQMGTWYSISGSEGRAVVFSIMADGILAPYVIFVSPQGEMAAPIPLGAHSAQILDRLPGGVAKTYGNRLEAGAALLGEKK